MCLLQHLDHEMHHQNELERVDLAKQTGCLRHMLGVDRIIADRDERDPQSLIRAHDCHQHVYSTRPANFTNLLQLQHLFRLFAIQRMVGVTPFALGFVFNRLGLNIIIDILSVCFVL